MGYDKIEMRISRKGWEYLNGDVRHQVPGICSEARKLGRVFICKISVLGYGQS